LMMAQPLHCSFAWLENVICPNYWGTPVHSLWICELWVFIQNNRATNYHCMILGGCWVTKISSEKGQGRQTGCLRLKGYSSDDQKRFLDTTEKLSVMSYTSQDSS
jgi:hypothetical protein